MRKKSKLSELNKALAAADKPVAKPKAQSKSVEANPTRGERGDFLKVTITLSPEMLVSLKKVGMERKIQGMKDTDVSSLIREAVSVFLNQ
ncbi:MAG: hypothetical protein WB791_06150 [Waddliaceae bacterium]